MVGKTAGLLLLLGGEEATCLRPLSLLRAAIMIPRLRPLESSYKSKGLIGLHLLSPLCPTDRCVQALMSAASPLPLIDLPQKGKLACLMWKARSSVRQSP